jgi:Ulp1 family protease
MNETKEIIIIDIANTDGEDNDDSIPDQEDDDDSIPNNIDPITANKNDTDILLVYPFGGDMNKIEDAASDLNELSYKNTTPYDQDSKHSSTKTRSHQIVIRVETYKLLEDGKYLVDSLVDFWMQWISRDKPNDVHFFTSHFQSTLMSEGVDGVKSWTAPQKKSMYLIKSRYLYHIVMNFIGH